MLYGCIKLRCLNRQRCFNGIFVASSESCPCADGLRINLDTTTAIYKETNFSSSFRYKRDKKRANTSFTQLINRNKQKNPHLKILKGLLSIQLVKFKYFLRMIIAEVDCVSALLECINISFFNKKFNI